MGRGTKKRTEDIRKFILHQLPRHSGDIASTVMKRFGISRQAAAYHLHTLTKKGLITATGKTSTRRYRLVETVVAEWSTPVHDLDENKVWLKMIPEYFDGLPKNVMDIWEYGITEMLNNAADHSDGDTVKIRVSTSPIAINLMIADNGVGIFRKIAKALDLDDEKQAILELAKGKFTTDPDNHSGEGIFFTSRIFDSFNIFSGDVLFNHDEHFDDEHWVVETDENRPGTAIHLELNTDSKRKIKDVFDQFAAEDGDNAFNKTVIPVNLLKQGKENLISRSQAKRLMAGISRFKTVVLDFKGVDRIGQAFADEIFRVYANRHPEVTIIPVNTRKGVSQMIDRAEELKQKRIEQQQEKESI